MPKTEKKFLQSLRSRAFKKITGKGKIQIGIYISSKVNYHKMNNDVTAGYIMKDVEH